MFSGQGSHYYQMGWEFYTNEPVFRKWMRELDELAEKIIGQSIIAAIYDWNKGKGDDFGRTLITHPAIFMVEYSTAMMLIDSGIIPEYVVGASLGEFSAMAISGIIDAEKALQLVIYQASCIENSCEPGGMISILERHDLYRDNPVLYKNSSLAGINFDYHFVISGFGCGLKIIQDFLKEKEISHHRMPVSFGFHSPNIDPAEWRFSKQSITEILKEPRLGYISSYTGKQLSKMEKGYFWNFVRDPILFREALLGLLNDGGFHVLIDAGPAGTLATFAKYIVGKNRNMEIFYTMTPYGNESRNLKSLKNSIFGQ